MKSSFIINIILPYIILGIIGIISYINGSFHDTKIFLFLLFLWIILKDIFLLFHKIHPISWSRVDYEWLKRDNIPPLQVISITNRNIFFPSILIAYITLLLFQQIHIFWWSSENINENIILIWVIISWVWTLFYEDIEKKYMYKTKSIYYAFFTTCLCFFLSIFWSYVILLQTLRLWEISYIIAFISGLLIFLIWMTIQQEDQNHQEIPD